MSLVYQGNAHLNDASYWLLIVSLCSLVMYSNLLVSQYWPQMVHVEKAMYHKTQSSTEISRSCRKGQSLWSSFLAPISSLRPSFSGEIDEAFLGDEIKGMNEYIQVRWDQLILCNRVLWTELEFHLWRPEFVWWLRHSIAMPFSGSTFPLRINLFTYQVGMGMSTLRDAVKGQIKQADMGRHKHTRACWWMLRTPWGWQSPSL